MLSPLALGSIWGSIIIGVVKSRETFSERGEREREREVNNMYASSHFTHKLGQSKKKIFVNSFWHNFQTSSTMSGRKSYGLVLQLLTLAICMDNVPYRDLISYKPPSCWQPSWWLSLLIVLNIHLHEGERGGGGELQVLTRTFLLSTHKCTHKYTYYQRVDLLNLAKLANYPLFAKKNNALLLIKC